VLGGDRRLEVVRRHLVAARGAFEQREPFGDPLLVPARAVLISERAQVARRVELRRQPRRVQAHQRGERVCRRRLGWRVLAQQRDQPDRLVAQLGAHRCLGRRAVVTLVEEQVERALHRGQARREARVAEVKQPLRAGERLLAPADPLLDRGPAQEERGGDLGRAEPAEHVEDQRELRVLRQLRLAAREHHPQLLVANGSRLERLVDRWRERPLALELSRQLGREGERGALAPNTVEHAVLRRRHQPGRRVLGDSADLPHLERAAERVLHDVFGEREVVHAEDAREGGDQPAGLTPEEVLR
jgi:hypothetical protein